MCVTEAGLPLTVCTLPSPQVISHGLIVSVPGSLRREVQRVRRPSSTAARPLKLSVGATLSTLHGSVLPASYVPSSSVALAEIV